MARKSTSRQSLPIELEFDIFGIEELNKVFDELGERPATNILRSTVHAVAGEARDQVRMRADVSTGLMKKSVKSKRMRAKPGEAHSVVFFDKKAFYWKFIEFGTKLLPERPFVRPVAQMISANMTALLNRFFVIKYEAFFVRRLKQQAAKNKAGK